MLSTVCVGGAIDCVCVSRCYQCGSSGDILIHDNINITCQMLCRIVLIKLELDSEMTTFVMITLNLTTFVVKTSLI